MKNNTYFIFDKNGNKGIGTTLGIKNSPTKYEGSTILKVLKTQCYGKAMKEYYEFLTIKK